MQKFCRSAIKRCFTTLSIELYSWLEHRRRKHLVASSLPFNQQFVIGIEVHGGKGGNLIIILHHVSEGESQLSRVFHYCRSASSTSFNRTSLNISLFNCHLLEVRSIKQSKNGFEPLSLIAMLSIVYTNRFFNHFCNIIRQHFPRDSKIGGNRRGGAVGLPMQLIASQAKWGVERLPAPFNMLEYLREMTQKNRLCNDDVSIKSTTTSRVGGISYSDHVFSFPNWSFSSSFIGFFLTFPSVYSRAGD